MFFSTVFLPHRACHALRRIWYSPRCRGSLIRSRRRYPRCNTTLRMHHARRFMEGCVIRFSGTSLSFASPVHVVCVRSLGMNATWWVYLAWFHRLYSRWWFGGCSGSSRLLGKAARSIKQATHNSGTVLVRVIYLSREMNTEDLVGTFHPTPPTSRGDGATESNGMNEARRFPTE